MRLGEQRLDPGHSLDQVGVAQGIGQPEVAAGAERLTRDDRDLDLVEDQGRLGGGQRASATDLV